MYPLLDGCEEFGVGEDITTAACLQKVGISGVHLQGFFPIGRTKEDIAHILDRHQVIFHGFHAKEDFYWLASEITNVRKNRVPKR